MVFLPLMFVGLIVLSPLIMVGHQQGARRLGEARIILATATLLVLSLIPYILLLALYAMAWRAEYLIGPQFIQAPPHSVGANDPVYRWLGDLVDSMIWAIPCCFPGWLSTLLLLRNSLPLWVRWMVGIIYLFGCLALLVDPGGRIAWWSYE